MRLWPVQLSGTTPRGEPIVLGPLRRGDRAEWARVRAANESWLAEWEASAPDGQKPSLRFGELVRHYNREARAGRTLPFAIRSGGRLVGQLHLFGIIEGSLRSCAAGYWVAQEAAGRGIAPTALALAGDHVLEQRGLHRIEVNIRPENVASLAVAAKLGFREEGLRLRFLHINGAWRDHRSFALTTEDLGGRTLMERWHDRARASNTTDNTRHIGDTPPHVREAGGEGT